MPKKINFITLGCSKNKVDSEYLLKQFECNGYFVDFENYTDDFDIVIINILDAKEESINTIISFIKEKQKGKLSSIIVFGCLIERYKEELTNELPEVDAFFGINSHKQILQFLDSKYNIEYENKRIITTPSHYSYLKISEGCNRRCSFCAIPIIRGRLVSKNVEDLLEEAKYLSQKGVKELILIAQDLTTYGTDLYKKNKLDYLLNKLSDINDIEWIRLHYAYPAGFPINILNTINSNEKFCKYIDIPIQHISDHVLKSMKRGISKEKTKELLYTIREKVSNVAIRTTLITGYPNETEENFAELYDFVKEFRFERLGVFGYSAEEGTAAYNIKQINSKRIINSRIQKIMKIQEKISAEVNKQHLNKKVKLIIDSKEENYYIGRTQFDSPEIDNEVFVKTKKHLNVGQFYDAFIYDSGNFELFAKV